MTRFFAIVAVTLFLAGCSEKSQRVPSAAVVATPVAFNVSGAPTVEFSVPDMMCPEGCGVKVKEILSEQPGAKEVLVDFDAKKATVAVEGDGKFDAKAAVAALVDHQFKNSSLKNESGMAASTSSATDSASPAAAAKPNEPGAG